MRNAVAFAVFLTLFAAPASAQTLRGPAVAIDGRTLEMTGTPIRLAHIDAPEIGQSCTKGGEAWACGAAAKDSLSQIVEADPITCTLIGSDPQGLALGRCETRIFDVGREIIRRGLAIALDTAPSEYSDAIQIAQRLRSGLWEGEFEQPAQWRAANPQAVHQIVRAARVEKEQPIRAAPLRERRYTDSWGCAIKGNRSRRGEWIYHLPGQNYYEVTRPEELFCTEREAQAAGYRRSKI